MPTAIGSLNDILLAQRDLTPSTPRKSYVALQIMTPGRAAVEEVDANAEAYYFAPLEGSVKSGGVPIAIKADVAFDAVVSERHQFQSNPTEHPVEDGSVISDHVIHKRPWLDIEGVISDFDPHDPSNDFTNTEAGALWKRYGRLLRYLAIQGELEQLLPLGGTEATLVRTGLGIAEDLLTSLLQPSLVNTYYVVSDRVLSFFNTLVEFIENDTLLYVNTKYRLYDNMLLTNLQIPREPRTGRGLKFILTFKHIKFVGSETTALPRVPATARAVKERDGGDKNRSSVEDPDASVIVQGLDLFGLPDANFSTEDGAINVGE